MAIAGRFDPRTGHHIVSPSVSHNPEPRLIVIVRTGAFLFAQNTLPLLLNAVGKAQQLYPTLLFTGATAAVKANTWLQPFNVPKHALRALSQGLHDEFSLKGVHVAHVIIDGIVRMPLTWFMKPLSSWDAKMDPNAVSV